MTPMTSELHLRAGEFQKLFTQLGPSLGFWRAAEIAALRTQSYQTPILDLGCGDGLITSFVLPRVDIGVDSWATAIEGARRRGLYERLEHRPIEHAPIPPGSVGTILSNSVLEHIADLRTILSVTARLLRPGGRLIFTVPTEAFSRWLMLPLAAYRNWRNDHYEHRNLWPLSRWQHELHLAGFDVVSVKPYLRREMVTAWDSLELLQRVWIGKHRLFSACWRRLPPNLLGRLAQRAARMDLAAPAPGGGRLIVAERRNNIVHC